MPAEPILFRSDTLLARFRRARDEAPSRVCCITFGSFSDEGGLTRKGFGEDFLQKAGIDAIHVVNGANHWYAAPEMPALLQAIATVAAGYPRRITYGSSMGGYAALRFARGLGATTAIALSPQFSIHQRLVPFETRWRAEAAAMRCDEAAFQPPARMVIFHDPCHPADTAHAALYAAAGPALLVPLRHAGHPIGPLLVETGQLGPAIQDILADRFDAAALQRAVRARRAGSPHYLFQLSRAVRKRSPATAIGLLRRAAALSPESHILSALARLLDQQGAHAEAGPLHREALRLAPHNARARIGHAYHLEALRQPAAAMAELRRGAQGQSGTTRRLMRQAQWRLALRRWHCGWLLRLAGRANRLLPPGWRHRPTL